MSSKPQTVPRLRGMGLCAVLFAGVVFGIPVTKGAPTDLGLSAEALLERRQELDRTFQNLEKNPRRLEQFQREGRLQTVLCKHCHGADGISPTPGVPTLAGQDPVYLVDQFERFAAGWREDFLMGGLARMLSEDDKIKLAVYYASLPVPESRSGQTALSVRGGAIYHSRCAECHGADGRGETGYARLAGQRADYVVKMLREFRTPTGKRSNPWMSAVAVNLSDEDILALADYVSVLD